MKIAGPLEEKDLQKGGSLEDTSTCILNVFSGEYLYAQL